MYNYLENVKSDILDFVKDQKEYLEGKTIEDLYDNLFIEDAITGNASGSYYCNAWKAEEALTHNWDLLNEALDAFGESDIDITGKGPEWCDVTIRCYLLGQALEEVKDEIKEILEEK